MTLVDKISRTLKIPSGVVVGIGKVASRSYKSYEIPKRDGTSRAIFHPSKELKALQRWLLRNVIESLPVHPAAMAYRKGFSTVDNAKPHSGSKYLLRMDLENFFPSITSNDIRAYIARRSGFFDGFSSEDVDFFCALVCRKDRLTIGAPTSPALSNALCYELDEELSRLATSHGATYTRYADDLFFSSGTQGVLAVIARDVEGIVSRVSCPNGLRSNPPKRATLQNEARGV